jgi:hypothetical protein
MEVSQYQFEIILWSANNKNGMSLAQNIHADQWNRIEN